MTDTSDVLEGKQEAKTATAPTPWQKMRSFGIKCHDEFKNHGRAWCKTHGLDWFNRQCLQFHATMALALLALLGLATGQHVILFDGDQVQPGHNVFLRLIAALGILAGTAMLLRRLKRDDHDAYLTRWWNIGQTPDEPSWSDVLAMTLGIEGKDPVTYAEERRPFADSRGIRLLFACLMIFSLAIVLLTVVASNDALPLFRTYYDDHTQVDTSANLILNFGQNLTAFLALLAAAISIYFTHRQLQAKVKADSRQAWIDKLRGNIARFVALCDDGRDRPMSGRPRPTMELTQCRIELEMMLNPSEKDHRLLMYFSQKLAFYHRGEKAFMEIQDAQNVKDDIKKDAKKTGKDWESIIGEIPAPNADDFRKGYSDLIGYMVRLSHVVLKREWERVKATR